MKHTWNADVALGQPLLSYIRDPEGQRQARAAFDRVLGGEDFVDIQCYGDEHPEWFESTYSPIRDKRGRVTGLTVFSTEVTERMVAQQALRESRGKFEALLYQSRDGFAHCDANGAFVIVNPAYCRMLGYTEAALLKLVYEDITPKAYHELDRQMLRDQVIKRGYCDLYEKEYQRQDGTRFPIEIRTYALFSDQGTFEGTWSYVRDITGAKQAEAEKQALQGQLLQQDKMESIGLLAGGIAHEINNPINGIMNYAQMIKDQLGTGPVTEIADEIIYESDRVAGIVRNLLQFARYEKQQHSPARMRDIVDRTLALVKTLFLQDKIQMVTDIPEDLPTIKCRSQQIQQVLINLLTNARDALNQKYPGTHPHKMVRISSRLQWIEGRRWLRTMIEDRGSGIADRLTDKIFEPFFTTKPREAGTGLGLSISYGIVKEHKGELYLRNEPGPFTRFYLDLPVDNGWQVD